jgi:hypothetical protein
MLRDISEEQNSQIDRAPRESEPSPAKRAVEQASRQPPGSVYWLIAKNENGRLEVLAVDLAAGEEMLPVFSHVEEAEMFLRLWEVASDGWQVRESTVGELVSVLYGPCAGVRRVALDPLPGMVGQRTVGLVSLGRERFLGLLLGRERSLGRRGR